MLSQFFENRRQNVLKCVIYIYIYIFFFFLTTVLNCCKKENLKKYINNTFNRRHNSVKNLIVTIVTIVTVVKNLVVTIVRAVKNLIVTSVKNRRIMTAVKNLIVTIVISIKNLL